MLLRSACAAAALARSSALSSAYASSLSRFVEAQDDDGALDEALGELRAGRKEGCWVWFVFPQLAALGRSPTARFFGLAGREHARAYLEHQELGPRLRAAATAALVGAAADGGRSALQLMGAIDDVKLRSCMTLFEAAAAAAVPQPDGASGGGAGGGGDNACFAAVLDALFDGTRDPLTLDLLRREASGDDGDDGGEDGGGSASSGAGGGDHGAATMPSAASAAIGADAATSLQGAPAAAASGSPRSRARRRGGR